MPDRQRDSSSFRDNRGFIYWQDGIVYRQINASGQEAYDLMMTSGLYDRLVRDNLLISHEEVPAGGEDAYKVIRPELIGFISYPYEWSFQQLKDAALATLAIQKLALKHDMTLRDASAYNVQFANGRAVFIDTLSFGRYTPGEPWIAYRQFCQHFLAPLALMSRVDLGLSGLLRVHLDGIPLPLAARLLPVSAKLNLGLATHINLHAKFQRQHEGTARKAQATVSATSLAGLLDNLERTVRGLKLPQTKTQWGDYYDNTNYGDDSFKEKGRIVKKYLEAIKPGRVLDLGANDGPFSRIAVASGAFVVSADIDPVAVDSNWRQVKAAGEANLLPLLIDITNPSPDLGWANQERLSFGARGQSDVVLALALIHHLAIANNLPLGHVAEYFAKLAPQLVIEFVPKQDSQVKRLLATREDIFADYTAEGFERAFSQYYTMVTKTPVDHTDRILYHFKRKTASS